jgi:hypothetical protein
MGKCPVCEQAPSSEPGKWRPRHRIQRPQMWASSSLSWTQINEKFRTDGRGRIAPRVGPLQRAARLSVPRRIAAGMGSTVRVIQS